MTSFNWVSAALINGKGTMVLSLSMVVVGPDDIKRYFVWRRQWAAALFAPIFFGGRRKGAVSTSLCGSRHGDGETLTCQVSISRETIDCAIEKKFSSPPTPSEARCPTHGAIDRLSADRLLVCQYFSTTLSTVTEGGHNSHRPIDT